MFYDRHLCSLDGHTRIFLRKCYEARHTFDIVGKVVERVELVRLQCVWVVVHEKGEYICFEGCD